MRKLGNIADILGDQFLKVDSLNLRCYVLTFEGLDEAPIIIEDNTLLPSPPLTIASSPAPAMVESNQEESKQTLEDGGCIADFQAQLEVGFNISNNVIGSGRGLDHG